MKRLSIVLALSLLAGCASDEGGNGTEPNGAANAGEGKGDIIGDDDRRDEFSEDVTDELRTLARSTAMIIMNESLTPEGREVLVGGAPLYESYFMCEGEAFREQPSTGMCSAWLVGADVMVTNGHCITSQSDCEQKSFVFDYALNVEGQDLSAVPNETVFQCEQMLAWDNTKNCDIDYAVVRLDREVTNRAPLKVRQPGEEIAGDNLVIIGHPFGLPRKYALDGDVLEAGDNGFTTTHDIFGGNSGSAVFDATTGVVQGIATCGGSNMVWEFITEGWELESKTGQPCDASCDEAGEFTEGTEESTCTEGVRRGCVCENDRQLVWERRECLSFENETEGQCTREQRNDQFTCETAPWLCATPFVQNTGHLANFAGEWDVHRVEEAQLIAKSETVETTFTVEAADPEAVLQAASFTLFFDEEATDAEGQFTSLELAASDLTITLTSPGGTEIPITSEGIYRAQTAYEYTFNPENNPRPFDIPVQLFDVENESVDGVWTLTLENIDLQGYLLSGFALSYRTVAADAFANATRPCVGDACRNPYDSFPDPILETFEGDAVELTEGPVTGAVAEGWQVEVLDENGEMYEAFKAPRSQTVSLQSGELALTKDFGEDIGGRDITIDYRYDGIGWFQVWADDQIIFAKQDFAAARETFPIPFNARKLSFVIGSVDGSQVHELTLFDIKIAPPAPGMPAE